MLIENKQAKGVELKDGSVHEADEVVCNGDVAFAYKNYIPKTFRGMIVQKLIFLLYTVHNSWNRYLNFQVLVPVAAKHHISNYYHNYLVTGY